MNILYLGYWNADDPLTRATIYPNLNILQDLDFVAQIVFVNTERKSPAPKFAPDFVVRKIIYKPLFSKNYNVSLLNKMADFVRFPKEINRLVSEYTIDLIITRGSPAGALAYLSYRKSATPFLVESFEPHAGYMLESGVWNRWDLRFIFQNKWENLQKKYAKGLMPVAENYRKFLLEEGIDPEKIVTVPCSIDSKIFAFDSEKRALMRKKFNIDDGATVGIYVGKFGGLYMGQEVFDLYAGAFRFFKDFFLVILTPVEFHEWLMREIRRLGLPENRVIVNFVGYEEVADYLNMSDFAYATYKPGTLKAYLSPIKVGEFWACGLPVLLTRGVGDESAMIEQESAGVLFDPHDINTENLTSIYERVDKLLKKDYLRKKLSLLAANLRDPAKARAAYEHLLRK